MANYTLGVDASRYQEDIDPQSLIAAGVKFVILKATELQRQAGPIDPFFARNKAACEAAGLMVAAYGFIDPVAGIPQADLLTQTAPHMIDAEDLEAGGVTLAEAEDFINEVQKTTGRLPILYTADYVLKRIGGYSSTVFASCPLWLEQIGATTPVVPLPWHTWTFWQFGYMNIGGKTFDANYFNGSLDELRSFFNVSAVLKDEAVVATADIPAFKAPAGELHSWLKVGDIVTINTSTNQSVNGVTYLQATDDRWFRAEQLGAAPIPTPPPVPVATTMYVDPGDVVNVRKAASTTAAILVQLQSGTRVDVYLPADSSQYKWAEVAAIAGAPQIAGSAWISALYLTVMPPK